MREPINIEIWSDFVCPFCYIGKRHFEKALEDFHPDSRVKIRWRSFQLHPSAPNDPALSLYDYLASLKGQTREWSERMHEQVTEMAARAGLTYRFDIAKVSNTLDAHRLLQLAITRNKGDEFEERIFHAYFTEGKFLGDRDELLSLSAQAGISYEDSRLALSGDNFIAEVENDKEEAKRIGIRGVPFFLFEKKYAISGAQPIHVFREILEEVYKKSL